jgi:hypothetical protein
MGLDEGEGRGAGQGRQHVNKGCGIRQGEYVLRETRGTGENGEAGEAKERGRG